MQNSSVEKKHGSSQWQDDFRSFLKGQHEKLLEQDFVDGLLAFLADKEESHFVLYKALFDCLGQTKESTIRHRALYFLTLGLKDLNAQETATGAIFWLERIVQWYKSEEEYSNGLGVFSQQVARLLLNLTKDKKYEETKAAFTIMFRILRGSLFKDQRIKSDLGTSLRIFYDKEVLERLWRDYCQDKKQRGNILNIFKTIGRPCGLFLLKRLIESENKNERLLLLITVVDYGPDIAPVLSEYLDEDPPWYVIRNIISIYGKMKNSFFYHDIKKYASHENIRVQQEVVASIVAMGGNRLYVRLLDILPKLFPSLQKSVLVYLFKNAVKKDAELAEKVLDFIESSWHSLLNNEEIFSILAVGLKNIVSQRSFHFLRNLHEECQTQEKHRYLMGIIENSLATVAPALRHRQQKEQGHGSVLLQKTPENVKIANKTVQGLISTIKSKSQSTTGLEILHSFYKHGLHFAREGDVLSAQIVLKQLEKIDTRENSDYSELTELIAEQQAIYQKRAQSLELLLDNFFSLQERQKLIGCMCLEKYRKGEHIMRAGEVDTSLYFVLRGSLQVHYNDGDRSIFLKRISSGESFGHTNFFTASVWAENILARENSSLAVLSFEKYQKLLEELPDLQAKMERFCSSLHVTPELVRMSGGERRQFQRFSVDITAKIYSIESYRKKPIDSLQGQISDISQYGYSILVYLDTKERISSFLGMESLVKISFKDKNVQLLGNIIAVHAVAEELGKYSFHIKLFDALNKKVMNFLCAA